MTTNGQQAGTSARRLVGIGEVAELLGVNVRHVRRLVYERRIPYIKWGHLIRFDPEDVADWIDAHRQHPRMPMTDPAGRR